MLIESQSADPAVHRLSIKLAEKCTAIVKPLLRQEEVGECIREFYLAIREELDKPKQEPEV